MISLTSIVVVILVIALALFLLRQLVPEANPGYYGGTILAVILLLFLLSRFGGLTL